MTWYPAALDDLTWEQQTAAQHLPDLGAVYLPTFTPDGKGGRLVTYADDADATLACRLAPLTERQKVQLEDVIRSPETETLSLPYGTVLPDQTKVVLVGRLGFTVKVYACPHPGNLNTLALALVERIEGS